MKFQVYKDRKFPEIVSMQEPGKPRTIIISGKPFDAVDESIEAESPTDAFWAYQNSMDKGA